MFEPAGREAQIVSLIRATMPDVIAVYRFGSTAHGQASADSDVDLAVLAPARLTPEARWALQERLADILRQAVDLVDLRQASTVMASQVITTGQLLLDADEARRGAFEDLVYSSYARLNEERRGILERVAAEGTVYGR
mgnify:CR=1 FL=1